MSATKPRTPCGCAAIDASWKFDDSFGWLINIERSGRYELALSGVNAAGAGKLCTVNWQGREQTASLTPDKPSAEFVLAAGQGIIDIRFEPETTAGSSVAGKSTVADVSLRFIAASAAVPAAKGKARSVNTWLSRASTLEQPPCKDIEGLGVFYLGRGYDLAARKPTDEPLLYDAKDLTTHAVCVGMTGSGKTGLCLALLEEAAIDGIPAIAIDPKGDLGEPAARVSEASAGRFRARGSIEAKRSTKEHIARRARGADRPSCGRRASPSGDRTARASSAFATRSISRSTRRAPARAFR